MMQSKGKLLQKFERPMHDGKPSGKTLPQLERPSLLMQQLRVPPSSLLPLRCCCTWREGGVAGR